MQRLSFLLASLVYPVVADAFTEAEFLARRTQNRFKKGHLDNELCWDRGEGKDGFLSVIDIHNHFKPFYGPSVPFDTYFDWMTQHGIVFSVVMGLGQRINKTNADDPECCYYLHCPSSNYSVVPDLTNDLENAEDFARYRANTSQTARLHLTFSATFPNLQNPSSISSNLAQLETKLSGESVGWVGEVNVFKHALGANGFWTHPRITKAAIDEGSLDALFNRSIAEGWPTTLHCDLGCDQYASIPNAPAHGCHVPQDELDAAAADWRWWKMMLQDHYVGFFNTTTNMPLDNFKKVQHLRVLDTILSRYPRATVVWAHMGLSKELLGLHPDVHTDIMALLFDRHPLLHTDMSWDIISKIWMLDYKNESISQYLAEEHEDITEESVASFDHVTMQAMLADFHDIWENRNDAIREGGGSDTLTGPTVDMAVYADIVERYNTRYLTGTDFVASFGTKEAFPGLSEFKPVPTGCMKDLANHDRQHTDTSSINIFFSDETFRKVVLGENFFRITGLANNYAAPPVCPPPANLTTPSPNSTTDATTAEGETQANDCGRVQQLFVLQFLLATAANFMF